MLCKYFGCCCRDRDQCCCNYYQNADSQTYHFISREQRRFEQLHRKSKTTKNICKKIYIWNRQLKIQFIYMYIYMCAYVCLFSAYRLHYLRKPTTVGASRFDFVLSQNQQLNYQESALNKKRNTVHTNNGKQLLHMAEFHTKFLIFLFYASKK